MTKTDHLELYTWAEEDFVSMAQMNENFALLDEALADREEENQRTELYAEAAAGNLANVMLQLAHQGADTAYAENVLLDTFADAGKLNSHANALAREGLSIPAAGTAPVLSLNPEVLNNGAAGLGSTARTLVASGVPDGYFSFTSLSFSFSGNRNSTAMKIEVEQNGTVLAQTTLTDLSPAGASTGRTVALSGLLDPNYPCHIYMTYQDHTGAALLRFTNFAMAGTGVRYSNATVITKAQSVRGKAAKIFVRAAGSAPQLAFQLGSGGFLVTNPTQTRPGDGATLYVYRIDLGADSAEKNLALRFRLTSETVVRDYCAAIL